MQEPAKPGMPVANLSDGQPVLLLKHNRAQGVVRGMNKTKVRVEITDPDSKKAGKVVEARPTDVGVDHSRTGHTIKQKKGQS